MPSKRVSVTFDLTDYFSKFGFGDGDDGAAVDAGYENRCLAIRIINEEFKKAAVAGINAIESDIGSMHNNCRIELQTDGKPLETDGLDTVYVTDKSVPVEVRDKIEQAMLKAYGRFEKEAA